MTTPQKPMSAKERATQLVSEMLYSANRKKDDTLVSMVTRAIKQAEDDMREATISECEKAALEHPFFSVRKTLEKLKSIKKQN